jgi:hypothetical protein
MLTTLEIYIADVLVFFWPAIVACTAIGYIAASKERKLQGALTGLVGGFVLALILVAMKGHDAPIVRS